MALQLPSSATVFRDRVVVHKTIEILRLKAVARLRWLTEGEAMRLQHASSPDLRPLVRAELLTGCRAGELLALRAGDFEPRSKTLLVADGKSDKPRRVKAVKSFRPPHSTRAIPMRHISSKRADHSFSLPLRLATATPEWSRNTMATLPVPMSPT
jgi:integrase